MSGTAVVRGDVLTATGRLTDESTAAPLANRRVKIMEYVGTTYYTRASTYTDSNGNFSMSYTLPTTPGVHTLFVNWDGDATYLGDYTAYTDFTVEARTPNISFALSDTSVDPGGQPITWSGRLTDPKTGSGLGNGPVYLQRQGSDVAGPINTDPNGNYSGTYTATPGTYRARYPGGAVSLGVYEAALSQEQIVSLLEPELLPVLFILGPLAVGAALIGASNL